MYIYYVYTLSIYLVSDQEGSDNADSVWGPFWPPVQLRGRGRVPIAGWSLGGVGQDRGFGGGRKKGVV